MDRKSENREESIIINCSNVQVDDWKAYVRKYINYVELLQDYSTAQSANLSNDKGKIRKE
jgi:hypothetical protein